MSRAERQNTLNQLMVSLASFVAIALLGGALGGLMTAHSVTTWYTTVNKPPFNPPDWVFGPVWTTLYIMMGVAAGLVHARAGFLGAWRPLNFWCLQLALNVAWSGIFFGMHMIGAALAEIIFLWMVILATTLGFFHIRSTVGPLPGLLMIPYLAWVSFAAFLNFSIWRLN